MTKLRDVIEKKLTIPFGDIVTSPLAKDEELCREIQQILYENNFYRFEVDGIYGKITREALRDFKESYALSGGDLLGPTTAEFILRADKPAPVEADYDFSTPKGTQRAIIRECRKQGLALNTQIAYVLATVQHETAHTFKPVKEAFWLDEDWRRRKLWYFPYYGRGFVQLTHQSNYQKYSNILGINLADEPDRVMEPKISLFILIDGMAKGRFTGARLGQFVNSNKTDFVEARKVVNPGDKAHAIKNLAESWLSKINLESIDSESPVPEMPEELEILLFKQVMDS